MLMCVVLAGFLFLFFFIVVDIAVAVLLFAGEMFVDGYRLCLAAVYGFAAVRPRRFDFFPCP